MTTTSSNIALQDEMNIESLSVQFGRLGSATTAVAVLTLDDGEPVISVGVAVCNPNDVFDEDIGDFIAIGRALKSLGESLEDMGIVASDEACVERTVNPYRYPWVE